MRTTTIKFPNNKLRECRRTKGLTQEQVAQMLNMHCEDRLSRWEQGMAMPSAKNLFKLAKLYQVKIEDLYPEFSHNEIILQ